MGEIIYCIIAIAAILAVFGSRDQKGVMRMIARKVVMKYVRPFVNHCIYSCCMGLVYALIPLTKPS